MNRRVTVRPTTEADAPFAYHVRETTMRDYVVATWGAWNAEEARGQIEEDIRRSRSMIVEVNDRRVGLMRADELPTHVHLDQLFILPEHQRQGIGQQILLRLLQRAKSLGLPLRLWVLRINPAAKLYERLGFKVIEQTPASLYLECLHQPVTVRSSPGADPQ
ncbi:MAG: GNAT family N-acetyltransferase [Opitutaceae bacterium]|nr:GNAT family N-acetyltransferase [Opitutaceae bacterium]